ncbi:DNA cytosine methyltransferase [Thiorhodococcus fuscus]|uniref:Cytosine-specific methyltransferase n=1 Tax=Thiorhodococcus fuscus TaxID=527200 RepID=A0ABW4YC92_9GAMM
MMPIIPSAPVLIDLFSGCGGFSLGAHRAGFHVAAAFDNDPILSSSFESNFPSTLHELRDVAGLRGEDLRAVAGGRVDGIFGGPPCQGFSDIGRRDRSDPRRRLLAHFYRLVAETGPTFFVMENVRGLAYRNARDELEGALAYVRDDYALFGPTILDAADFGAATARPRLFVVGVRKDRGDAILPEDIEVAKRPAATVRDAIGDLEGVIEVGERDGFDVWRIPDLAPTSDYARRLSAPDRLFTSHRTTAHAPNVVERFARVEPGGKDEVGRHPRLRWDGQCPTLRAGTGSDRGSYQSVRPIHPDHPRVITVREAARLQGFPDSHLFHPTVWHSFRMIGNSVSPIISEALFRVIAEKLYEERVPTAASV